MRNPTLLALLWALICSPALHAASASTTLQVVWPNDMLGIDQPQALAKAVNYLKSEDFAHEVAKMPQDKRNQYAMFARINNPRNTNAIAQSIADNLSIESDEEHCSITLTFTNNSPDLALYVAQRAANCAVSKARYYIAEKENPEIQAISDQMEQIQDNIQMLRARIRTNNQMKNRRAQPNGASIGAPVDSPRVVHPERNQANLQNTSMNNQIKELRTQYNELNKQLRTEVTKSWKGKPRTGLIVIDKADLDSE
ncbi:hypothetical protein [Cerasicoccus maritimus]|uniref:hypothetical protein n=1 Tax=Cerasicoccus maritimus TaxID=490089 RepID=UPI00285288ED|nr:hypothetical protein [Cerasicoccus maritimus]